MFIDVTSRSPNTQSPLTSISSWMIGCISFIVGSLFEYACILFYQHVTYASIPEAYAKSALNRVDSISLLISISSFVIFNAVFWNRHDGHLL